MSVRLSLCLALCLALCARVALAQSTDGFTPLDARGALPPALAGHVTLSLDDVPLRAAVDSIARRAGFAFVADRALVGLDRRVTMRVRDVAAASALLRALDGTGVAAMMTPSGQVVLVRRPTSDAAPVASQPATIRGVVRDAESRTPLEGARIEVLALARSALARENGRFELPLPAGTHAVRVTRLGYRPATLSVATSDASIDVALERASIPLSSVVVTPGTFGIMQQRVAASQTFSRRQIESVPQIGEDIYRAVNRLPGVAADDFSSDFRVRGASGSELYTTLDGVELVRPFHLQDLGGALSIIDVQAIGGVDLTTGGPTAEIGDRLTGALTMRSREPRTDRVHGTLGISLMNARAMAQGGFGGGRGAWLASVRRGYLDIALELAGGDSLSPRYGDVFAKVQYDLPERWALGGRVSAQLLRADDRLHYADDDGEARNRYGSEYLWLAWDGAVGHTTSDDGEARLRQRTILSATRTDQRRAGRAVERSVQKGAVTDDRDFDALGVRQDWSLALSPRASLRLGGDVRGERATFAYANWVRRDSSGQRLADGTRPIVSVTDSVRVNVAPTGTRTGVYASQRIRPIDALTIEAGLRYDRSSAADDRALLPRLNVAWQPRHGTTLRAAWGRTSQSQSLALLHVEDGDSIVVPAKRAEHRVVGIDRLLRGGLLARVELYERRQFGLWPYAVNNTNGDVSILPDIDWDRVRVHPTDGRARGIEMMLRRDGARHVDWIATYARADAIETIGGVRVPGQSDQKHAFSFDAAFHPVDARWRLSAALTWHTGWPYTASSVRIDTLVDTPARFAFSSRNVPGPFNSARLPTYTRVDLRWMRYVATRHWRGSVFLEVYNLLDAENSRGFYNYAVSDGRRGYFLRSESNSSLPRLPAVGVSWEF